MTWNEITADYRRLKLKAVPIYGIVDSYNGKILEKQFDSTQEAQEYIKENQLSRKEFYVSVIGKRGLK